MGEEDEQKILLSAAKKRKDAIEQFKQVGGSIFNQALMPDNNGLGINRKAWESPFLAPSHLGYKTDCKGVTALSPITSTLSASAKRSASVLANSARCALISACCD